MPSKNFTEYLKEDAPASNTTANISPGVIPVAQVWMDRHKAKLKKQAMDFLRTRLQNDNDNSDED